ncbi:MAG: hypothetical protein CME06_04980 [Gemmatimonadetes bacterium]|nr:hypothetical protein [Gemmatimonadota bacterium]
MHPSPDLTISLVNWNTRELVCECIESIRRSTGSIEVEIVVVDNDSKDGSVEAIGSRFPDVHLITNRDNLGFTRANNQAWSVARGRHFMLLNSDTVVLPGALDRMVAHLDEHPDVGAVAARTWLDDQQTLELAALPPLGPLTVLCASSDALRRFAPLDRFHRESRRIWRGEEDVEVRALVGACFMVRGDIRDRLGPLDENMFMYFEDADWSHKIHSMGLRMMVLHDAFIVHYHDKSGSNNPKKDRIFEESMVVFYKKMYGPATLAALATAMRLRAPLDRIYGVLKRRISPDPEATPIPLDDPILRWPPIRGAERYLIEIGLDPAFAAIAGRYVGGTEIDLSALATPETVGRSYHWRVFGVEKNGTLQRGTVGCARTESPT